MTASSLHKQRVLDLLKSIETGDPAPISAINPDTYIQHNLAASDGLAGFGVLLQQLPPNSARVHTIRVFDDGDYVFSHTDYTFFGPKIGFDIFRFDDGLIVEHRDNLQETADPNPSGHTMIDGPTQARDLEQTEENKALVRRFVEDILVNGRMDKLAGSFDGDNYIQHSPLIADGLSVLGAALQAMAAQGVTVRYDRVHQVLGEGDFVLVVSEGHAGRHVHVVLRPLPGREWQDRGALGHHRDHPAAERVEEPERQLRIPLLLERVGFSRTWHSWQAPRERPWVWNRRLDTRGGATSARAISGLRRNGSTAHGPAAVLGS